MVDRKILTSCRMQRQVFNIRNLCCDSDRPPVGNQVMPLLALPLQAGPLAGMLPGALGLLGQYLVDEDVPFITTAHYTLRHLLATPAGAAALEAVEPLQRACLAVFAPSPQRQPGLPPTPDPVAARCAPCLRLIPRVPCFPCPAHISCCCLSPRPALFPRPGLPECARVHGKWLVLEDRQSHSVAPCVLTLIQSANSSPVECNDGMSISTKGVREHAKLPDLPKKHDSGVLGGGRARLGDGRLWGLEARGHDAWVCGLADALLGCASSPVLRLLQRAARKKPALAALVLPHAFADLAAHDRDTTLMALISDKVREL